VRICSALKAEYESQLAALRQDQDQIKELITDSMAKTTADQEGLKRK
jgi:hypothetical protein